MFSVAGANAGAADHSPRVLERRKELRKNYSLRPTTVLYSCGKGTGRRRLASGDESLSTNEFG